jgi:hypothetical protein
MPDSHHSFSFITSVIHAVSARTIGITSLIRAKAYTVLFEALGSAAPTALFAPLKSFTFFHFLLLLLFYFIFAVLFLEMLPFVYAEFLGSIRRSSRSRDQDLSI